MDFSKALHFDRFTPTVLRKVDTWKYEHSLYGDTFISVKMWGSH
jgi:hypothetical protein